MTTEIMVAGQQTRNLPEYLQADTYGTAISVYGKGKVSAEVFARGCKKIKSAFPDLPKGWYEVLNEFLDIEKFTDKKFADAVVNLIKTCKYPRPTVAEVLSFDRMKRKWTHAEIVRETDKMSAEGKKKFWEKMEFKEEGTVEDGSYRTYFIEKDQL
jgi:hypothetical protein